MRRPNILLITSDQQHRSTLGATNPRIETPNLDRLAREGTRFDRAYCANPTCSPSRASIITGLHPAWHHCWTIGTKLPEDVPTIGDMMQAHGYSTALVGKAHFQPLASAPGSESLECQPLLRDLDFWRGFHGPWYGFQRVELARNHADESHAGQHYAIWMEENGLTDWRRYFRRWPPDPQEPRRRHAWDLPEAFHTNAWIRERITAHLEDAARSDTPFFLWASFFDPHPPYLVPEPWASMYNPAEMDPGTLEPGELERMPPHYRMTQDPNADWSWYHEDGLHSHGAHSHLCDEAEWRKDIAVYYGMVSFMDHEIGRLLEALDRLDLAENTLVIFTTDHGHYLGQHGLRHKCIFHYEDLLRLPMIVRFPGRVPSGRTSGALQSLVDFGPTMLRTAGIEIPGRMQGVDQYDVWCGGKPAARDHVIVENRHSRTRVNLRTYVEERYKLTVYRGQPYGELFDLQEDPEERRNLWDDPASLETKMQVMHRFLQAELEREPTRMPRIASA